MRKQCLIVFCDSRGIVQQEFVPPDQTMNGVLYPEILSLRARVILVQPDLTKRWILHHNIRLWTYRLLGESFSAEAQSP